MNCFHKFAGLDALGTFLFALAAFSAGVGAFIFREVSAVNEVGYGHVVIDNAVVIELYNPGDVHVLGARQAITAFRAGNRGPLQVSGAYPADEFQVSGQ